ELQIPEGGVANDRNGTAEEQTTSAIAGATTEAQSSAQKPGAPERCRCTGFAESGCRQHLRDAAGHLQRADSEALESHERGGVLAESTRKAIVQLDGQSGSAERDSEMHADDDAVIGSARAGGARGSDAQRGERRSATRCVAKPSRRTALSRRGTKIPHRAGGRSSAERGHAPRRRLVLHAAKDVVLAAFADQPVVLTRFGEAQDGEVSDEADHEDDG